jgi:hypothetical protein
MIVDLKFIIRGCELLNVDIWRAVGDWKSHASTHQTDIQR